MKMQEPKVSVSIITYNHRDYISQAIDSVLAQQVDFAYEIIIGDDYSTDGTREILLSYQQQHPDIIQLVLHPRRYAGVPGRLNNITNLYACRGRYVAMLDGDDYWISHDKLQRQVDFLEQHSEYVLAFHDALVVSDAAGFAPFYHSEGFDFLRQDRSFLQQDIAKQWFVPTSSVVFRNNQIGEFPEWFWNVYSADYFLQMLLLQHGNARYFYNVKGARRKSSTSFSALYNKSLKDNILRIKELKILRREFKHSIASSTIDRRLAKYYFRHAVLLKKQKSYLMAFLYMLKCIYKDKRYVSKITDKVKNLSKTTGISCW